MSPSALPPDELVALLADAEKSQAWLGRRLGVRAETVWHWVHGDWEIPEPRHGQIRELLSPKCPVCGHNRTVA